MYKTRKIPGCFGYGMQETVFLINDIQGECLGKPVRKSFH